jgi:tRNA A37 methylthiotransferase MiaB
MPKQLSTNSGGITINKKLYIWANSGGCPQNQLDAAHAISYLKANGYSVTGSCEEADMIFVNGCAYRESKEEESTNRIVELNRKRKPGSKVIVSGCLPKIAPGRIKQFAPEAEIIPATELSKLEEFVKNESICWDDFEPNQIPDQLFNYAKPFRRFIARGIGFIRDSVPVNYKHHCDRLLMYDHSPDTYIVRIAEGCLGNCTYCAIKRSRGRLRSKPVDKILDEVRRGVNLGKDEILLTATEFAAYGRDIKTDLADLLSEILDIPGRFSLLLFYANPKWLIDIWDKLEPSFSTGRIQFVHLSLNGGSDNVLEGMQRGYTLAEFEKLVQGIKRSSPGTVLQTQVITGFPGENDHDFDITCDFFKRNYFHNVQVHAFDERPGTKAADLPRKVSENKRLERRKILYTQTIKAKLRFNLGYVCGDFRRYNHNPGNSR